MFGSPFDKDILRSIQLSLEQERILKAVSQTNPLADALYGGINRSSIKSALDSIQSPAYAGIANASDWLSSMTSPIQEKIQRLITESQGVFGEHSRSIMDQFNRSLSFSHQHELAKVSAPEYVPPDLATQLQQSTGNYAGLFKSAINGTVNEQISFKDPLLSANRIFSDVMKSAIKDQERYQSLAAQYKSEIDIALERFKSPFADTIWSTLFDNRLQEAVASVTLARSAGIDPRDLLYDNPALQAAEILDEATRLDQTDDDAVLAWQTDAYHRLETAFTNLLAELRNVPIINIPIVTVLTVWVIVKFVGDIESALQFSERLERWFNNVPPTEQSQVADDIAQARSSLFASLNYALNEAQAVRKSCFITKHEAPVRAAPQKGAPVIGRLPTDTCILVLERDGHWLRFDYQPPGSDASTEAWVYRNHLRASTE